MLMGDEPPPSADVAGVHAKLRGRRGRPLPEALFEAARGGDPDHKLLRAYLRYGGDVNARAEEDQATMLMNAAASNAGSVVSLLLDHGADVDLQDDSGISSLISAVVAGHIETTRLLLRAGASTELCYHSGETALVLARRYNRYAIAELIERTINVRRCLARLRRVARIVGRCAIALVAFGNEVIERSHRPGGPGFERARSEFEWVASGACGDALAALAAPPCALATARDASPLTLAHAGPSTGEPLPIKRRPRVRSGKRRRADARRSSEATEAEQVAVDEMEVDS